MASNSIQSRPRILSVWGLLCGLCLLVAACAATTDFIDFSTLTRSATSNDALGCPANFCQAKPDFITQPIRMSADALAAKVVAVLAEEPRTELVAKDETGLKFVFVQRSLVFRFPDTVNIAITPAGNDAASLAIYSHSNYGKGDFGVNLKRVTDWLAKFDVSTTGN